MYSQLTNISYDKSLAPVTPTSCLCITKLSI